MLVIKKLAYLVSKVFYHWDFIVTVVAPSSGRILKCTRSTAPLGEVLVCSSVRVFFC